MESGHGLSAHGDCHHPQSPSTRPWCLWSAPTSRASPLSSALENRGEMLPLKSLKWGLMDAGVDSRSSWNDTGEGGCVALSVGRVAQRS